MYSCFMYLPGSHSQFNALLAGGGGCNPNHVKLNFIFGCYWPDNQTITESVEYIMYMGSSTHSFDWFQKFGVVVCGFNDVR